MNYYKTLIAVADDCPVEVAQPPVGRGGKPTVATFQFELLSTRPGELTQEDVLFQTWLTRQTEHDPRDEGEVAALRVDFFSEPRACLRASPLPKRHGWGLAFDDEGRITLHAMESPEYAELLADERITVRKAMRTKR